MLSVLPIQSKEEQREVAELCGAEYDVNLLAYKILDSGRVVGMSQFKMSPEGGKIITLNGLKGEEKFEYLFMLGRGTLSFIELCGAKYAYLEDKSVDPVIAKAIGFSEFEGRMRVDLEGFFNEPCKNCKGNS